MIKDVLNKIFNSKIFWFICSLLIAVFLWLYVVRVENPDDTITLYGVSVEFIGADDILADRGLIVTQESNMTVTLRLSGRRTDLSKLTNTNVTVSVDLSNIRSAGEYPRMYTVNFPTGVSSDDITIVERTPSYLNVQVEEISRKTIDVVGVLNVSVADGYQAGTLEISPDQIVISGPEEEVSRIDHAQVTLERENLTQEVTTTSTFVYVDANGEEVDAPNVTADVDEVRLTLPIETLKEVPLTVELIHGGGTTDQNVVCTIDPGSITLSGDASVLQGVSSISLGSIDLSRVTGSTYTTTMTIRIPEETTNVTGVVEAKVTIEIVGLSTTRVTVSDNNFEFINVSDGYVATAITQSLDVTIRGPEDVLSSVVANNIRVVCDLENLGQTTGRYAVTAQVYVDGYADVGAIGEYTVVVQLERD